MLISTGSLDQPQRTFSLLLLHLGLEVILICTAFHFLGFSWIMVHLRQQTQLGDLVRAPHKTLPPLVQPLHFKKAQFVQGMIQCCCCTSTQLLWCMHVQLNLWEQTMSTYPQMTAHIRMPSALVIQTLRSLSVRYALLKAARCKLESVHTKVHACLATDG